MAINKVVVSGNGGAGVKVNDIKVVGEQATSADFGTIAAAGASYVQTEANAVVDALNAVIAALKAHGLIADA